MRTFRPRQPSAYRAGHYSNADMPRDIDQLTMALQRAFPAITVRQLRVPNPGADDDGLWLIEHPEGMTQVQVESSTGDAPFLVESELAPPTSARTVDDALRLVTQRLGLGGAMRE